MSIKIEYLKDSVSLEGNDHDSRTPMSVAPLSPKGEGPSEYNTFVHYGVE